jgi:hypothetical protein
MMTTDCQRDYNNKYHKEWRDRNDIHFKQYQAEYRKENKDKLHVKITCDCGSVIIKKNRKSHDKTRKHRLYMELKEWRKNTII